jgi:hypothetical protein
MLRVACHWPWAKSPRTADFLIFTRPAILPTSVGSLAMPVRRRSVLGSICADAIVSHDAGRIGITGWDSGLCDLFTSFFAGGNLRFRASTNDQGAPNRGRCARVESYRKGWYSRSSKHPDQREKCHHKSEQSERTPRSFRALRARV